jgi:hypothetical protein
VVKIRCSHPVFFETDCLQIASVVVHESMLTFATISAFLLATAAVIRSFRAVENQSLQAIVAGKALWAELYKKIKF